MIHVTYNDHVYNYPGSLSEITLTQYISWHTEIGNRLAARRRELDFISDPEMKELHNSMLFLDEAVMSFAFFTGIPLAEVQANVDFAQVLAVYRASNLVIALEERDIELQDDYMWIDQRWKIYAPTNSVSDTMTHAEFSATMDLSRIIIQFAEKRDWGGFISICAAYLRRPDEPFDPAFLQPDNARNILMQTLPMDIALAVGYFLSDSMALFTATLNRYTTDIVNNMEG